MSSDSAACAYPVAPNDTKVLYGAPRGVYVGTGGDLSVVMADGTSAVFVNVQGGSTLPIRVKTIKSTGTTAGAILALY